LLEDFFADFFAAFFVAMACLHNAWRVTDARQLHRG
jgi:hypothetical protein